MYDDTALIMSDLAEAIDAMRAKHNALLKLVEAGAGLAEAMGFVEWEPIIDGTYDACPWCHRLMKNGHSPTCQREQKLTAWNEAKGE